MGIPDNSNVGYVALYNRDDADWLARMLNPFDIWLTRLPGTVPVNAPSSDGHMCGQGLTVPVPDLGPFMIWCGRTTTNNLPYVTVILRAASSPPIRLLSIGEMYVYQA